MANPHIVCAGPNCGAIRKEANHWFVIKFPGTENKVFHCEPLTDPKNLRPWNKPVCGQSCAQKLFDTWMAKASGGK